MDSAEDLVARPVVLDASVLINLVVLDDPIVILSALTEPTVVAEAASEVRRNPRTGASKDSVLEPLYRGPLNRIEMTDAEAELFVDLVGAPAPNDLDDGEAATLACAITRGLTPLVDERKARRRLGELYDGHNGVSTVGLYRELHDRGLFPKRFVASCIFQSLRFARMRVASEDLPWVVSLLTPTQIAECPSLPLRVRNR